MLSAQDNSDTTNNRESFLQKNVSYSLSTEAARLKSSYTLPYDVPQQNPSYSIAAEPQALKLRLSHVATAYSTAVRDYDYPGNDNIYAMISDSQVRLEAPPPTPAPRTPCHPIPSPPPTPPPPRGGVVRRCLGVVVVFMLLVLLTVALAAGVLSLAIHFTGFIDTGICDCTDCVQCADLDGVQFAFAVARKSLDHCERSESSTGESALSQIAARIMMLEAQVQSLTARLDAATATTSTDEATPSSDMTTPPIVTTTSEPLPVDESLVTLSGLNLFQDCNTSIEDRCTIDPAEPPTGTDFLSCTTNFLGVPINRPGDYVLNVQCLIVEETVESNPLIATLDIDANLGFCRCFVPTLNLINQVAHPVTCGLQITRCTIPTNITARIL